MYKGKGENFIVLIQAEQWRKITFGIFTLWESFLNSNAITDFRVIVH